MSTVIISILIIIAAVFGIRSYRKRLISGCCGSFDDKTAKRVKVKDTDPSHYLYQRLLKVDGMSCGNCTVHVENALNLLEGVWAKADLDTGSVYVYMKGEYGDEKLKQEVKAAGYVVYKIDHIK